MPKSIKKHQAQQVKFVSLSAPIKTQNPYLFKNYMAHGSSDPFLVTNDTATQYVLKRPLQEDQNFYDSCLQEILDCYLPDKREFRNPNAYHQAVNNFLKKLKLKKTEYEDNRLAGSKSAEIFYQRKDIFTINLINFLAPECSPHADTFYKIKGNKAKQKFYTGTVFLENYQNWKDIYHAGKINGNVIDGQGYVLIDKEDKRKMPIKGLGCIAVLTTILGINDVKPDNWGLIDRGSYYQAVIIDSGKSLTMSVQNKIKNAKDILQRSLFDLIKSKGKYVQICALPDELLHADYIQQEAYEALDHIKTAINQLSTNDLTCPELEVFSGIFCGFSDFKELLIGTIRENAMKLYEQVKSERLSAYSASHSRMSDEKFYTSPYKLFAPKHKSDNINDFLNSPSREYKELSYKTSSKN